jgi:hypothetical protein
MPRCHDLLNIADAAAWFGVHRNTITRWIAEGRLSTQGRRRGGTSRGRVKLPVLLLDDLDQSHENALRLGYGFVAEEVFLAWIPTINLYVRALLLYCVCLGRADRSYIATPEPEETYEDLADQIAEALLSECGPDGSSTTLASLKAAVSRIDLVRAVPIVRRMLLKAGCNEDAAERLIKKIAKKSTRDLLALFLSHFPEEARATLPPPEPLIQDPAAPYLRLPVGLPDELDKWLRSLAGNNSRHAGFLLVARHTTRQLYGRFFRRGDTLDQASRHAQRSTEALLVPLLGGRIKAEDRRRMAQQMVGLARRTVFNYSCSGNRRRMKVAARAGVTIKEAGRLLRPIPIKLREPDPVRKPGAYADLSWIDSRQPDNESQDD